MLRALTEDELLWLVLIHDGDGSTETEWYETRAQAEEGASSALESHAARVYICRCHRVGETS